MPLQTLHTVVDAYQLHRQSPKDFPFLLESVAETPKIGRYDILFSQPQQVTTLNDIKDADFLTQFDNQWLIHQGDEDTNIPAHIPFRGGWFVFFAYELAQQIESTLLLTNPCIKNNTISL